MKNLAFGLAQAIPKDVAAVWGARLIAPDDLVYNRQDLKADTDEAKQELVLWLNPEGGRAIERLLGALRERCYRLGQDRNFVAMVEDDEGIIFASTNASGGYVYVTGYLKNHVNQGKVTA